MSLARNVVFDEFPSLVAYHALAFAVRRKQIISTIFLAADYRQEAGALDVAWCFDARQVTHGWEKIIKIHQRVRTALRNTGARDNERRLHVFVKVLLSH